MDFLFKEVKNKHQLISNIAIKTHSFKRGEIIFYKGLVCNKLYFIIKGSIFVKNNIISQNQIIGDEILFSQSNNFKDNYIALTNILLSSIDYNDLLYLFEQDYIISINFLQKSLEKLNKLSTRLEILSKKNTKEKLIYYLYIHYKETNQTTFLIDKQQITTYLNVDKTKLNQELLNLKKLKIIDYKNNVYTIIDINYFLQFFS